MNNSDTSQKVFQNIKKRYLAESMPDSFCGGVRFNKMPGMYCRPAFLVKRTFYQEKTIKTLLHQTFFEKCSFKTTSFLNIFRKESVVKSVYNRCAVCTL